MWARSCHWYILVHWLVLNYSLCSQIVVHSVLDFHGRFREAQESMTIGTITALIQFVLLFFIVENYSFSICLLCFFIDTQYNH